MQSIEEVEQEAKPAVRSRFAPVCWVREHWSAIAFTLAAIALIVWMHNHFPVGK